MELIDQVFELRAAGLTRNKIASQLSIPQHEVSELLAKRVLELHATHSGTVDELYVLHVERTEDLWRFVKDKINHSLEFDDKLFKTAITILERQAKLLGLDKPTSVTRDKQKAADWMLEATPHELIAEVESYGYQVPERFKGSTEGDVPRHDAMVDAPVSA